MLLLLFLLLQSPCWALDYLGCSTRGNGCVSRYSKLSLCFDLLAGDGAFSRPAQPTAGSVIKSGGCTRPYMRAMVLDRGLRILGKWNLPSEPGRGHRIRETWRGARLMSAASCIGMHWQGHDHYKRPTPAVVFNSYGIQFGSIIHVIFFERA